MLPWGTPIRETSEDQYATCMYIQKNVTFIVKTTLLKLYHTGMSIFTIPWIQVKIKITQHLKKSEISLNFFLQHCFETD